MTAVATVASSSTSVTAPFMNTESFIAAAAAVVASQPLAAGPALPARPATAHYTRQTRGIET